MSIGTVLAAFVLFLAIIDWLFGLRPGWSHYEVILIGLLALAMLLGSAIPWREILPRRNPPQQ